MSSLAAISFAFPAALWALLALPAIWWLLRFTPPRADQVRFPPLRLLLDLADRDETASRTPWWLIALRLALAALIILAVASPYVDRGSAITSGSGNRLILLDDGWAAAQDWPARQRALNDALDAAAREGVQVSLATTTPLATAPDLSPQAPEALRARVNAMKPKALNTGRMALAATLAQNFTADEPLHVIWLSDGLDDGDAAAFAKALLQLNRSRATLAIVESPAPPAGLAGANLAEGGFEAKLTAAPANAPRDFRLAATAGNGRVLAEAAVNIPAGETIATARLEMPLELRNEVQAIRILGQTSAGGVHLIDDRARRKRVGLMAGTGLESAEPLLSPLYYASRALEPYAELQSGGNGIAPLLDAGLSMLILADIGRITPEDAAALEAFLAKGGVLLRFAGPRLAAAGGDDFVPVRLREGGRDLGGSMGWEKPQELAPFAEASPFAGLKPDPRGRVQRQVLAEPDSELAARTWASLVDGTPLVSAEKRGQGLIVLFHVTANNDWSNLPISGLFVEMLRRILDMSPGLGQSAAETTSGAAFTPLRALDGFGDLTTMPAEAAPIAPAAMAAAKASPATPAGLYTRAGATRAINLDLTDGLKLLPALPQASARAIYGPPQRTHLAGFAYALALLLFALDSLASLWIMGGLKRLRGASLAMLAISLVFLAGPQPAHAQEATQTTTFAYVITGEAETDATSQQGLEGLSRMLMERTAVEPGTPVGVNVETDELVFYPLIYWPVLPEAQVLSPKASDRLAAYMRNGGMVLFDTRDAGTGPSPAGDALQRILSRLNIPALEPVPEGHVLTRSFYLLKSFPGRFDSGKLWVEQQASASADNVSAILTGANDFAAAWALDDQGNALYPVVPGGDDQRETAFRVGINIVMYALTGNYKADQVHVPALLERLGQ